MSTLFLACGLFFPRLTLLFACCSGSVPTNDTPLAADIIAGIITPRVLIAYWTYTNHEHPFWTAMYLAMFVAVLFGSRSGASRASSSSST